MGMVIVVIVVVDNKMFDTIIIIIHNRNHESWYILIYSVFLPVESTWDKIYCKPVRCVMSMFVCPVTLEYKNRYILVIIKEKVYIALQATLDTRDFPCQYPDKENSIRHKIRSKK